MTLTFAALAAGLILAAALALLALAIRAGRRILIDDDPHETWLAR